MVNKLFPSPPALCINGPRPSNDINFMITQKLKNAYQIERRSFYILIIKQKLLKLFFDHVLSKI